MPQTSERAQALEDIDATIKVAAYTYLLGSDEVEEEEVEEFKKSEVEHMQDLLVIRDVIADHRYLSHDASADRYEIDILEAYIYQYPETAFVVLFRMHQGFF